MTNSHPAGGRTTHDAGTAFQELVDIMSRLRGPDGCPWDREQTIATLRPFVLEETYEVLDAIDREDHDDLRGEIGDLLFEGVFLAQIARIESATVKRCSSASICARNTPSKRKSPISPHSAS